MTKIKSKDKVIISVQEVKIFLKDFFSNLKKIIKDVHSVYET